MSAFPPAADASHAPDAEVSSSSGITPIAFSAVASLTTGSTSALRLLFSFVFLGVTSVSQDAEEEMSSSV